MEEKREMKIAGDVSVLLVVVKKKIFATDVPSETEGIVFAGFVATVVAVVQPAVAVVAQKLLLVVVEILSVVTAVAVPVV